MWMDKRQRVARNRTAYVSMLWGQLCHYIIEALVSGIGLLKHCAAKRILFVDNDLENSGFINILRLVWDVRRFEFYDAGHQIECTQKRLRNIWSKMLPWKLLSDEVDAALLLDTDLLIRNNIDTVFTQMSHADCCGVFRGSRDFDITKPRPASTIKSWENTWCKGGGINGGVVLFKPSKRTFNDMDYVLKEKYRPKDTTCAEQDFWSWYFGVYREGSLGQLDVGYNFQIHQLSLSVPDAREDGRWLTLARSPENIYIYHFSAVPKPSNFLAGNVAAFIETCPIRPCFVNLMQNHGIEVERRAEILASLVFDHHSHRRDFFDIKSGYSKKGRMDSERDELLYNMALYATNLYVSFWFDEVWPILFIVITDMVTVKVFRNDNICGRCGFCVSQPYHEIHAMFKCAALEDITQSFDEGSQQAIWNLCRDPFFKDTGKDMINKLLYLDKMVAFEELDSQEFQKKAKTYVKTINVKELRKDWNKTFKAFVEMQHSASPPWKR